MAGRLILLTLVSVLVPVLSVAEQGDGPRVARLIQSAEVLLTGLEALDTVAPDNVDLGKVQSIIQDITPLDAKNSYLLFLRARYMVLTGRTGDASLKLLDFVETPQGQTEWRAFRMLGNSLREEFPSLAKSNYTKAEALNPGETSVLFGLSVCALSLGEVAEAVRLARETTEADGRGTLRYISHLARTLQAAGKWDEALYEAEAALQMAQRESQRDPVERSSLAALSAQYGLVMSILQVRISAQLKKPVNDFLRFDTCLRRQSRLKEKLTLHDWLSIVESRVTSTAPNTSVELLKLYGRLLREVGRTQDAIEAFEHVIRLSPVNPEAEKALGELR